MLLPLLTYAIRRLDGWASQREILEPGTHRSPLFVSAAGIAVSRLGSLETFLTPAFERALRPGASHRIERHTSKRSVRADIR